MPLSCLSTVKHLITLWKHPVSLTWPRSLHVISLHLPLQLISDHPLCPLTLPQPTWPSFCDWNTPKLVPWGSFALLFFFIKHLAVRSSQSRPLLLIQPSTQTSPVHPTQWCVPTTMTSAILTASVSSIVTMTFKTVWYAMRRGMAGGTN